jgi:hypothetical protein
MDGKMARARRWNSEKFQHNSVSTKIGEEKVRERLLFIPLEVKREGLDECQVLELEQESESQERGRPT